MIRIALLLTLLVPTLMIAQADYEYLGPDGSWINSMSRTAEGTIYTEAYPYLFRLRPGSEVWERIPHYDTLTSSNLMGRVFLAFSEVLLTFSGCCTTYLSADQGETWQRGPSVGDTVLARGSYYAAEWNDSLFLHIPDENGTLLISTDMARSWNPVQTIGDRQVLGVGSRGLYVNSSEKGLGRIAVGGQEKSIMPYSEGLVRGLAAAGDTVIVEIFAKDTKTQRYYRSYDAGDTWEALSLPVRYGITISGGRIWGADENGIHSAPVSLPPGAQSWSLEAAAGVNPRAPFPLIVHDDTIHYGNSLGYFRADPGQTQLERMCDGMTGFRIENILLMGDSLIVGTPTDFFVTGYHHDQRPADALFPRTMPTGRRSEYMVANGGSLFATGIYVQGICRSTDNGLSWDTLQDGATEEESFSEITLIGERLILRPRYAGDIDLLWSDNNGESWDSVMIENRYVYSITGSRDTLFLSTGVTDGSTFPVLRSFDGGITWDSTWGPQQYIATANLEFEGGSLYYDIPQVGLFRSDDLGDTWRRLQPRDPESADSLPVQVFDLEIAGDTVVLAGLLGGESAQPVLLLSMDRGATWRKVPSPPTGSFTLEILDSYLYTGSLAHGIFRIPFSTLLSAPEDRANATEASSLAQIDGDVLGLELSTPGVYRVRMYSLDGREAESVFTGHLTAGKHRLALPSATPGHYVVALMSGPRMIGSTVVILR